MDLLTDPQIRNSLEQARRLQQERLSAVAQSGWRVPEAVRKRYRERYLAITMLPEDDRHEAYVALFCRFVEDVESAGGFSALLNDLDRITIFGDICSGKQD